MKNYSPVPVGMGAGINSGPGYLGEMGSTERPHTMCLETVCPVLLKVSVKNMDVSISW